MSNEPDILDAVPFFGVHDIAAAVRFYVALGFARTSSGCRTAGCAGAASNATAWP
jgi:hypothetical protein